MLKPRDNYIVEVARVLQAGGILHCHKLKNYTAGALGGKRWVTCGPYAEATTARGQKLYAVFVGNVATHISSTPNAAARVFIVWCGRPLVWKAAHHATQRLNESGVKFTLNVKP